MMSAFCAPPKVSSLGKEKKQNMEGRGRSFVFPSLGTCPGAQWKHLHSTVAATARGPLDRHKIWLPAKIEVNNVIHWKKFCSSSEARESNSCWMLLFWAIWKPWPLKLTGIAQCFKITMLLIIHTRLSSIRPSPVEVCGPSLGRYPLAEMYPLPELWGGRGSSAV